MTTDSQTLGYTVGKDRRGVLGTLESWARLVREERHSPPPKTPATVVGEARTLTRHLPWISAQPWVEEMHAELKALHRDLSDAVGDHRQRPVGRCAVDDEHGVPCGGPLMPTKVGGCRCVRCGDDWPPDELARLGLLLHEIDQGA